MVAGIVATGILVLEVVELVEAVMTEQLVLEVVVLVEVVKA